ncbi:hypothetical protein ACO0QE_000495 [Hanseniaspora vineae]
MENLVRIQLKEFKVPYNQESTDDVLEHKTTRQAEEHTLFNQRVRNYDFLTHDYADPGVHWCRKKIETLNLWDDDEPEEQKLPSVSLMDVDPCVQEDVEMNDDGLSNYSEMEVDPEEAHRILEAEELIGNPQVFPDELVFQNEKNEQSDISLRKIFKVMVSPTELGVSMAKRGEVKDSVENQSASKSQTDEEISHSAEDKGGETATSADTSYEENQDAEQDKNTQDKERAAPVDQDPVDPNSAENETEKEKSQSKEYTFFDSSKPGSNSHQSFDHHTTEKKQFNVKTSQPYNLEINNHYYNYVYIPNDNNASDQQNQAYQGQMSLVQSSQLQALPEPWSKDSHPHSKFVYLFTSYLQLFLNSLLYMGVCSLLLMFLRAFYHDLKATWNQELLKLHYESSVCKFQYFINKCSSQPSPALQAKCLQWGQCMDRDNDQMYVGKTASIAKIVGTMINEVVEPIGWKVVLLFATASYLWIFGLNLMFGFVRAKSYYSGAKNGKQTRNNSNESFSSQADFDNKDGGKDEQSSAEELGEPLQRKRIAY